MNNKLKPSLYLESLVYKEYEKLTNILESILGGSKRINSQSIYASLDFEEASNLLDFYRYFPEDIETAFEYYQKLGWVSLDYLIPKSIIRFMEKYEGI